MHSARHEPSLRGVDQRTLMGFAVGFRAAGAAMGIQIIAPVHHELDCLKLAAVYETAAPVWLRRAPPGLAA
jgi:Asp-tRNA(Asn)/Glu-tRNA(Gln) amidotransferase A subunit family amidase